MIFLTIAFCLISTGQCKSVRVPEATYPTIAACQIAGLEMAAAIASEMSEEWHRPTITCGIDPKNPAG